MPSDYRGQIAFLEGLLPSFQHIASSTNASPIVVTTTTPHGMLSTDTVVIDGHLVNTNANGTWEVVNLSATTFQLLGSTGNGVGGASGTSRYAGFGSAYQIPSVGDDRDIGAISSALEAVGDRTALLLYLLNFKQEVYAGGVVTYHEDAEAVFSNGSVLFGVAGANIEGQFQLGDGTAPNLGVINVSNHSVIELLSGGAFEAAAGSSVYIAGDIDIDTGATFELNTQMSVQSLGSIVLETDAHLDVHGGAAINFTGSTSEITGTCLLNSWNAAAGSSLTFNGGGAANALVLNNTAVSLGSSSTVADAASTTKSGPLIFSGAGGFVGERNRLDLGDANVTLNPELYEVLYLTSVLSANRSVTLQDPPSGALLRLRIMVGENQLFGWQLNIKDQGGTTIFRFDGNASTHFGWVTLRFRGSSWMILDAQRVDLSATPPTI